jgi:hypothetical protein
LSLLLQSQFACVWSRCAFDSFLLPMVIAPLSCPTGLARCSLNCACRYPRAAAFSHRITGAVLRFAAEGVPVALANCPLLPASIRTDADLWAAAGAVRQYRSVDAARPVGVCRLPHHPTAHGAETNLKLA